MRLAFIDKDIYPFSCVNRYNLLCKAAYAELKANAESEVTPKTVVWSNQVINSFCQKIWWSNCRIQNNARCAHPSFTNSRGGDNERLTFSWTQYLLLFCQLKQQLKERNQPYRCMHRLGRSSYVSAEILATVPEPGAMAAAGWYSAA